MKKAVKAILASLMVSVILIMCIGCGSTNADAKGVAIAKKAIEIADDYLDMNISYSEAADELDELYDELGEYYDSMETSSAKTADLIIHIDIGSLKYSITMDGINSTSETYEDVISDRNELASDIGAKKRK